MAIESYSPDFIEVAGNSCIWRKFTSSGEEFAAQGLTNLSRIMAEINR